MWHMVKKRRNPLDSSSKEIFLPSKHSFRWKISSILDQSRPNYPNAAMSGFGKKGIVVFRHGFSVFTIPETEQMSLSPKYNGNSNYIHEQEHHSTIQIT